MSINEFRGETRWLSNFHSVEVVFEGMTFPTTEHAYQAAKTHDLSLREMIRGLDTPGKARKAGRLLVLENPEEWNQWNESRKFAVMEDLQRQKFSKDPYLRQKLLDTGDVPLVEGNWWHDNCWGSCLCEKCGNEGDNHLGQIIMKIRDELKNAK